jgi:hypothetical protein
VRAGGRRTHIRCPLSRMRERVAAPRRPGEGPRGPGPLPVSLSHFPDPSPRSRSPPSAASPGCGSRATGVAKRRQMRRAAVPPQGVDIVPGWGRSHLRLSADFGPGTANPRARAIRARSFRAGNTSCLREFAESYSLARNGRAIPSPFRASHLHCAPALARVSPRPTIGRRAIQSSWSVRAAPRRLCAPSGRGSVLPSTSRVAADRSPRDIDGFPCRLRS